MRRKFRVVKCEKFYRPRNLSDYARRSDASIKRSKYQAVYFSYVCMDNNVMSYLFVTNSSLCIQSLCFLLFKLFGTVCEIISTQLDFPS